MFYLVLVIFLIFLVIGVFLWKSAKGVPRKICQLERCLFDLLRRGFSDGYLIISHIRSKTFIQFRKYILKKGEYGIELSFPKAPWSEKYFSDLVDYCREKEIQFELIDARDSGELDFLDIDFGKDVALAFKTVQVILLDIFNHSERDTYRVLLENASVEDVLIDSASD